MNRKIEDIDKLFREGLNPEEDHLTFPEGDWPNMEQRLNRYDQRKKGIFWLTRLGSAAALLLLFFVLRTVITDDKQQVVLQPKIEQEQQPSITKKSEEKPQFEALKEEQKQMDISQEKEKSANKITAGPGKTLAHNKELANEPKGISPFDGMQEKEPVDKDSLNTENFKIEKSTTVEPAVISNRENPPLKEPEKAMEDNPSTAKEPVFASIEEPDNQPKAERMVHKMALIVMAAPAYNGVNNLNNGSIGNDFGLLVSYEIAKNWSLSTGGIYAKKLYDTGFRYYHPKNNIWKEYYPESINADCRVLDIPVNLSYTFFKDKNRTISAGSGISSYIMLKENYHFSYAETDPENPLSYELVNENRHWLSVLNFQATVEQRLSKKLSVSLQPYLKLPLRTVGFAGVKLQSLGVAANLNWNFTL